MGLLLNNAAICDAATLLSQIVVWRRVSTSLARIVQEHADLIVLLVLLAQVVIKSDINFQVGYDFRDLLVLFALFGTWRTGLLQGC